MFSQSYLDAIFKAFGEINSLISARGAAGSNANRFATFTPGTEKALTQMFSGVQGQIVFQRLNDALNKVEGKLRASLNNQDEAYNDLTGVIAEFHHLWEWKEPHVDDHGRVTL